MRFSILIFTSIFLLSILSINVHADPSRDVCKVTSINYQIPPSSYGPQGPAVVTITNPVQISSSEAGYQATACGVATFGAAAERSRVLDITNVPMTRANILNICAIEGHLTSTSAGTFDNYISALKTVLNNDPVNCYRITIKRLNSYTALPILTPPSPTIRTINNVQTVTFKPYNFRPSDIVDALQRVLTIGGVGLGGVRYDSASVDQEAHMFQPISINPVPRIIPPNETIYDMKIYDPYFGASHDVELAFDSQGRMYSNLWVRSGTTLWFHLEELFILENLGPCVNITNFTANDTAYGSSGGSHRPFKGPTTQTSTPIFTPAPSIPTGPTTPIGCGAKVAATLSCNNVNNIQCPNPNEYCSYNSHCTCKATVCGDGEKSPFEQCDDGNLVNGDGCSAACQLEVLCNGNFIPASQFQCSPPGSPCMYADQGGVSMGMCSATCTCSKNLP